MSRVLKLIGLAGRAPRVITQIPSLKAFPAVKLPAEASSTRNISHLLSRPPSIVAKSKEVTIATSLRSFSTLSPTKEYTSIDNTTIHNTLEKWRDYRNTLHLPQIPDCEIENLFKIFKQAVIENDKKLLDLVGTVFGVPCYRMESQALKVARTQNLNFTDLYQKYWHFSDRNLIKPLGTLALVEAGSKLDIDFIEKYGSNHNIIGNRSIAEQIFRAMYLAEGKSVPDIVRAIWCLRGISDNGFSYAYFAREDLGNYLSYLFSKDKKPWAMTQLIDDLVPIDDTHSGYTPELVFFRSLSQGEKSPCTILMESGNPDWKNIAEKINWKANFFLYQDDEDKYDTLDSTLERFEERRTLSHKF